MGRQRRSGEDDRSGSGIGKINANALFTRHGRLWGRCTNHLCYRSKFQATPPSPRCTMLTRAEWMCAVKINAHCCSGRKELPPQHCKAGGGGGAWNSEENRSFSIAERTERLVSPLRMRVYFEDTGMTRRGPT